MGAGVATSLKIARLQAGLSTAQVASELKVSQQAVNAWEREEGGKPPSKENFARLMKLYSTTGSEILAQSIGRSGAERAANRGQLGDFLLGEIYDSVHRLRAALDSMSETRTPLQTAAAEHQTLLSIHCLLQLAMQHLELYASVRPAERDPREIPGDAATAILRASEFARALVLWVGNNGHPTQAQATSPIELQALIGVPRLLRVYETTVPTAETDSVHWADDIGFTLAVIRTCDHASNGWTRRSVNEPLDQQPAAR